MTQENLQANPFDYKLIMRQPDPVIPQNIVYDLWQKYGFYFEKKFPETRLGIQDVYSLTAEQSSLLRMSMPELFEECVKDAVNAAQIQMQASNRRIGQLIDLFFSIEKQEVELRELLKNHSDLETLLKGEARIQAIVCSERSDEKEQRPSYLQLRNLAKAKNYTVPHSVGRPRQSKERSASLIYPSGQSALPFCEAEGFRDAYDFIDEPEKRWSLQGQFFSKDWQSGRFYFDLLNMINNVLVRPAKERCLSFSGGWRSADNKCQYELMMWGANPKTEVAYRFWTAPEQKARSITDRSEENVLRRLLIQSWQAFCECLQEFERPTLSAQPSLLALQVGKAHHYSLPAVIMLMLDLHRISPFANYNVRIGRLLNKFFLETLGLSITKYACLEQLVENRKFEYYQAFTESSDFWPSGSNNTPFVLYMLQIIDAAYKQTIQDLQTMSAMSLQQARLWYYFKRIYNGKPVSKSLLQKHFSGEMSMATLESMLRKLKSDHVIRFHNSSADNAACGRSTQYEIDTI